MRPAALAGILFGLAFVSAAGSVRSVARQRVRERGAGSADAALESRTEPPPAADDGPVQRTRRWKRRLAVLAAIALCLLLAGPPAAVVAAAVAAALPRVLRFRGAKRERVMLDEQLAEAVSSIAAGMRAGYSLVQALRFAADEGSPPLAGSIAALVDRSALGMPLGESIESEAHGGRDARLVAGVLRLHSRSGGDLPFVLDRLVETLRERRSAAREVRSLTAQARISGAILGLLSLVFFGFLALTAPHDLVLALRSSAGMTALITGFAMQGAAFLWIRSLLRVE
jgi:tight adherence protein B